jgi:hypothetical protein
MKLSNAIASTPSQRPNVAPILVVSAPRTTPHEICTVPVHALLRITILCMIYLCRAQRMFARSYPFPPDVSEYMLGLPKPRPRFDWFLFAIAAGALLALIVMVLSSFIFQRRY